ncbi:MAG: 2-C-methyl-D-erythritol 4-phosphate cytidylyltransferase, partial [Verrucomicrobiota bacterium]
NFSGCIAGGKQRHDSVAAGISRVSSRLDLIAVHDAARPLVTPAAIERCALRAMDHGAASLAHRVVDTVKRTDSAGQVEESISRENLWAMETPQIFQRELLISAYDEIAASGESVTDEVSAIQTIGRSVSLEENSEPNLKVTIPGDLVLAEAIIKNRTGSGLFRN